MFNVSPSRVFSLSVNHSELQCSLRAKIEAEHIMGKVPTPWDTSHSESDNKTTTATHSSLISSGLVWPHGRCCRGSHFPRASPLAKVDSQNEQQMLTQADGA